MSNSEACSPAVDVKTWHEPRQFSDFQCSGAACEDTCCSGWGIGVDRETYDRYQHVKDDGIGPSLRQFVQITAANKGSQYAAITLIDARCPFLEGGLCGVQKRLGEELLGQACATFPRVVNRVPGAIERSLDVSCPEAARLTLLNPELDVFQECSQPTDYMDSRMLQVVAGRPASLYPAHFDEVRRLVIGILQNRSYPVAKRLILLAHFCSKLQELAESGSERQTPEVVDGFRYAIQARLFDDHLRETSANAQTQLALILEIVVGRVSLDYTSPRYRGLYGEFIEGLGLRSDSTIPELSERYAAAYGAYFEPFVATHEYILEHYLVAYAYKTLLPYGHGSIERQYLVMASIYAMTRSLAVGLAALYASGFHEGHLVRAIQVCSRALEHCTSFPDRLIEILASKGIRSPAAMAVLTQAPVQPLVFQAAEPKADGPVLSI